MRAVQTNRPNQPTEATTKFRGPYVPLGLVSWLAQMNTGAGAMRAESHWSHHHRRCPVGRLVTDTRFRAAED